MINGGWDVLDMYHSRW